MTDFPQTKDWKVTEVREGKVERVNNSNLQKYYVDFEGADDTYWRRRAGDLPEIGKSYHGTISENKFGLTFKTEAKRSSGGGGYNGGSGGTMKERPVSEIAGARHAHNLMVASRNLEPLPANAPPSVIVERIGVLKDFADSLDRQTAAVSEAAAGGAGSGSPGSSAAPSPQEKLAAQDNNTAERGEQLDRLLEQAGLNGAAISIVKLYALENMTPEEVTAAIERLGTDSMRKAALDRLVERTEKFHEAPLPEAVPADDIPF